VTVVSLRHPFGWALAAFCLAALLYILAPLAVVVAASFGNTGYLTFPPQGFSLRWYAKVLDSPQYWDGFWVSVRLAGATTLISLALGVPAAYALVRHPFPGSRLVESLFLSPLMLPGLVLAVALTIFFAHLPLGAGTGRLALAHATICVPCVLRVAIPAFQRLDRSIEEAAQNLGAHPVLAFVLVSLPVVRPGILAAGALSFIMSFDEVEMAVFLASPREAPLTVALYAAAQMAFDPTLAAVASCLILGVFGLMLLFQLAGARR
jgi:putative spermidine/putrescine transport system permease protein